MIDPENQNKMDDLLAQTYSRVLHRLRIARRALATYGAHLPECDSVLERRLVCSCGLDSVRQEAALGAPTVTEVQLEDERYPLSRGDG